VILAVLSNGSILNGECHSDKNKAFTSVVGVVCLLLVHMGLKSRGIFIVSCSGQGNSCSLV